MAHTLLYLMGYNAPDDALLPRDFDWSAPSEANRATLDAAYAEMTDALRPWTIDFHVAQNDGTVHGTGSHDKTGRHCLPDDPDGKLDIPKRAGAWLDGAADRGHQAPLLGRLHVPQRRDGEAGDLELHPQVHDRRPRRPRLGVSPASRSPIRRVSEGRTLTRPRPSLTLRVSIFQHTHSCPPNRPSTSA